jgi:hypothetical protein
MARPPAGFLGATPANRPTRACWSGSSPGKNGCADAGPNPEDAAAAKAILDQVLADLRTSP